MPRGRSGSLLLREIRFAEAVLLEVLREQLAPPVLAELQRLWRRRSDDRARGRLRALPLPALAAAARASTLLALLVSLCEMHEEERSRGGGEGAHARRLFERLRDERVPRRAIRAALARLSATIVLTAHPTDATRWSVHTALARMGAWIARHSEAQSEPERRRAREAMARELTALWQTSFAPHRRPTPDDEVRHAVHRLESVLFEAVPRTERALARAYREVFAEEAPLAPGALRIGSWIGGDRDGNPFVTAEVTARALGAYRRAVLSRYRSAIPWLIELLTLSRREVGVSRALAASVARDAERVRGLAARVAGRDPLEVYRLKLNAIGLRLEQGVAEAEAGERPGARGGYASERELAGELALLDASLRRHRGARLAEGELGVLGRAVASFGMRFVSLDVRQHHARHRAAVGELFCPVEGPFASLDPERQQAFLEHLFAQEEPALPDEGRLSGETREVLGTLRALAVEMERLASEPCRDLVISNSEDSSAVLELLVLARRAGLVRRTAAGELASSVNLVPLFESLRGLERAPDSMERLYRSPAYREQLAARGMRQQIMLGYSDSAKESGYLAACFALQLAQRRLADQAARHGVEIEFFHGRGGTIGRGGGPAQRAIVAQPPGTVRGRIKLTEQGEVIASKYGTLPQALHHLELFAVATLEATLSRELASGPRPPPDAWVDAVRALAETARAAYRGLVYETPGFVDFFYAATPIDVIGELNIGSRPARRGGGRTIEGLRAIPWNFAWNQSRFLLSSWYGAGAALAAYARAAARGERPSSRALYRGWPFFRTVIDNLEQVLAKVDLGIAGHYAELAAGVPGSAAILARIRRDYALAVRGVVAATGAGRLLAAEPALSRSLRARSRALDALARLQLELLRRRRAGGRAAALEAALELTVNGIAAGLRNTG